VRIALRTSGGRGEFEIAGSHLDLKVHDVLTRHLVIELLPGQRMATGNYVGRHNGKPRIRLQDKRLNKHIYLILAAVLLLPKPKREISATPGGKLQLYQDNFSVTSIPFDVVEVTPTELVISPTQIILSNSSETTVRLDVIERLKLVMSAWEAADTSPSAAIAAVLHAHQSAFNKGDVSAMFEACKALRLANSELDDPLRYVLKQLDTSEPEKLAWMAVHATEPEEAQALGEVNLDAVKEAARNRIKTWRLLALRGTSGVRFSAAVKVAYNDTCLFTGFRLPKTELTGPDGVDAAHILPWAEYDLNTVSNGLCLSKLCHWAFDAGIITLNFNESTDRYFIKISENALNAEAQGLINLAPFYSIQGDIASSLLPKDRGNWPDVSFLKVYNDALNL